MGFKMVREDLLSEFSELEDPRLDRLKKYPLCEIIFLSIYGVIQQVQSWRGLEILGTNRLEELREFFPFEEGIPSHQTLGRVFSILKPKTFEKFFSIWSRMLVDGKIDYIAIDGKTVRGSSSRTHDAIHILHACAIDYGVSLAQVAVGSKTNEITMLAEIIDAIDAKDTIISVDALLTQKHIADKIIASKADYTMALKANHKNLHGEVVENFDLCHPDKKSRLEHTEKQNGRITQRVYDVIKLEENMISAFDEWKGLSSIGRVVSHVTKEHKITTMTRYFLLSYDSVATFSKSCRGHWGIESYHWILDVVFKEDKDKKRTDHAPRNFSLIRKFSLNMLRKFKQKLSTPNAQIQCMTNREFRLEMLESSGFKRKIF